MVTVDAVASCQMKMRTAARQQVLGHLGLVFRSVLPVRVLVFALLTTSTLITLSAQATQPTPLADVPLLNKYSPSPSVEVRFGTRDVVVCIVDTGSSSGLINHQLSRGANSLGRSKATVAGHRALSMPEVEVRDVSIGQASLKFTRFGVRDRSWVDSAYAVPCVLGGSFLNRFTVDIDFVARRLRLYKRGTRISTLIGTREANEYDLHVRGGYGGMLFDATVAGSKTRAFIDTGWRQSSANGELLAELGIAADDSRIRSNRSSLRSGKDFTERLLDLGPIQIGNNTIPTHPIDVGDWAAWFAERKSGSFLHMGVDLLANYRLLIDARHRQVVLLPGEIGG